MGRGSYPGARSGPGVAAQYLIIATFMVHHMFEKREVRTVPGIRRDDLWTKAWDWWSRQGFHLAQTGPYRFHGTSYYERIGLRREFDLVIDEVAGGSSVDLSFRASLTNEGLVLGAVTAVLLFPVAVVGGAVSYTEYETDARNLMAAFWQQMSIAVGKPSGSVPNLTPSACAGCGGGLLPDWKVCPYCGRPRASSSS